MKDVTKVTVYSNQPEVELFVNGESVGKKTAEDHFFYFEVKNVGESRLEAVAGECRDESVIRKVDTFNEEYRLKEQGAIINWFDVKMPAGRFSINDKLSDIMKSFFGKLWFMRLGLKIKKMLPKNENGEASAAGFKLTPAMFEMMGGFTVLRLSSMMAMAHISFTKEDLLKMNSQLNRIRKPKNK